MNALCGVAVLLACCALAAGPTRPVAPTTAAAPAPAVVGAEILAQGSGDTLWVVEVTPADPASDATPPEPLTLVRARSLQTGNWKEWARVEGSAVTLANQGHTLIVAMDDGQWLRVDGPESLANGPPLPGRGMILAMAGSNSALWAIGYGRPSVGPATSNSPSNSISAPATAPASAPTSIPATAPAPPLPPARPLLFLYTGQTWQDVTGLPDDLKPIDPRLVSMVLDGQSLMIALLDAKMIRTFRFDISEHSWKATGSAAPGFAVRSLKLLATPERLVLWAGGEGGAGTFWFELPKGKAGWSAPQPIEEPGGGVRVVRKTAAVAGNELRILAIAADKAGTKFLEQKYRFDGTLTQHFAPIVWPEMAGVAAQIGFWVNLAIGGVLLLLLYAGIRQRRARGPIEVDMEKLRVAPLTLRAVAGMIDLLPILIAGSILYSRHLASVGIDAFNDPQLVWWKDGAIAVYVAHTLLAEVFIGRSLGKLLVGLDVVNLDSSRPGAWALVLRNLLRGVDAFFAFATLLLIFVSPLRQRLGDAAAGTVVVLRAPTPAETKDGP